MSTPEERLANKEQCRFIFQLAAGEDKEALEYLNLLAFLARITDDVFDEFENVSQNNILALIEIFLVRLPSNSFYKKHQDTLFSQHLTMWNAWEASNLLQEGDDTDKIYAHVLRDYINEVLPVVALLTQGYSKMKEVSGLIRPLFKKHIGE